MMKVVDLDALRPKPARVRYDGKEYEVRRDLPTAKALDLMDILQQFDEAEKLSWEEQRALIERLPREAAALMTSDENEREELAATMAPDVAAVVVALALGRDRDQQSTPQKAAKGKKKQA